jgi:hypothetical protein
LQNTKTPFITRISIGYIFLSNGILSGKNLVLYADIVVYLNAAAIVIIVLYSIYVRRSLIAYSMELDKDLVSPSDFTILVRDLPRNIT